MSYRYYLNALDWLLQIVVMLVSLQITFFGSSTDYRPLAEPNKLNDEMKYKPWPNIVCLA